MEHETPSKIRSFIPVHTTTPCGELAIVTLHAGSLTYPASIDEFGREVREYASSRPGTDMVVDFHQVLNISSSVLTHLLRLKDLLESNGGKLRICGLHKNGRELFAVTKMDHLFCLQPDLRHALGHYSVVAAHSVAEHRGQHHTGSG